MKTTQKMAMITYAYQAFLSGVATPTQMYQIDLAEKALIEIDRIRDLSNPVNRRKLRILAESFDLNYMNDGDDDLSEAIIQAYMSDKQDSHEPLMVLIKTLATNSI